MFVLEGLQGSSTFAGLILKTVKMLLYTNHQKTGFLMVCGGSSHFDELATRGKKKSL